MLNVIIYRKVSAGVKYKCPAYSSIETMYYSNPILRPKRLRCLHSIFRVNDPTNDMFEDEYIQPEVKPLSFSVCKCTETGYEEVNIVTCEQSTSATCTLSESQEVGSHSCSINRRRRSVDRRQSVPSFNNRHSSMRKVRENVLIPIWSTDWNLSSIMTCTRRTVYLECVLISCHQYDLFYRNTVLAFDTLEKNF